MENKEIWELIKRTSIVYFVFWTFYLSTVEPVNVYKKLSEMEERHAKIYFLQAREIQELRDKIFEKNN